MGRGEVKSSFECQDHAFSLESEREGMRHGRERERVDKLSFK